MSLPGYDAWKLASPDEDMTEEEEQIQNLKHRVAELHSVLAECAAYFDQRSDISSEHDEDGSPRPNEEMKMLQMIEEVLS
jgi:hypothetical protein